MFGRVATIMMPDTILRWHRRSSSGWPQGWHIECGAMICRHLGETIDLQTGGIDLRSPHPESEMAQAEACNGVPFARHSYHSEHLLVDGRKATLWAGVWAGLGYLAGDALQHVADETGRFGTVLVSFVVVGAAVYVLVKWIQRRLFLRNLRIARVTPEGLKATLDAGSPALVIDLRSDLDVATTPWVIPDALRISADGLEKRHHEIPRDREVIVYCS